MLFQSSIRKELARSFGATLVVLITIILTIVLIRTLGQASRGSVSPQDVMLVMAYSTLGRLPTILSLSLFIAMVSTLSRMYRDSEMVVWFVSGRGLADFVGPLFRFAWPVLLVIALSALWVWPWSNQMTEDMKERYEQRGDLDRVAPGQFQESSGGDRVFFVDRDSEGRRGNDIFIASNEPGKRAVTTARSGRIERVEGGQNLTLEKGQRLEFGESTQQERAALKVTDFETYSARINSSGPLTPDTQQAKAVSTWGLLKNPTGKNQGELAWRLGLALSALNFVVMAVALASVNPRAGRSSNLIFVLLTFVVYTNLINLSGNWVASGAIGLGPLMLALHGGVLALTLAWLAKRHWGWTLRGSPGRWRQSAHQAQSSSPAPWDLS